MDMNQLPLGQVQDQTAIPPEMNPQNPQAPVDNAQAQPDPMEMLPEVVMQYMDMAIGVKNDGTLAVPVKVQSMVQLAQAISSLVPLLQNDQQNQQAELMMKAQAHQQDLQMKHEVHQTQLQMQQEKHQMEMEKAQHDMQLAQVQAETQRQGNQQKMKHTEETHKQKLVHNEKAAQQKEQQQKQAAQSKPTSKQGK